MDGRVEEWKDEKFGWFREIKAGGISKHAEA
jgi:hypothetical protein